MAITLGLVEAVDDNGVYVSMPGSRGVLRGPFLTLQDVAVGDQVLAVTTDDGENVIVGQASAAAPRSTPASSTDNTVARFDGTGGALQASGVTIDDNAEVSARTFQAVGTTSIAAVGYFDAPLSGYSSALRFRTGTSNRWFIGKTSALESGSNAGSNLQLYAYDDSGSGLGVGIEIARATRRVTIGAPGSTAGLELGTNGPRIMAGTGSPESVVSAPVGSLWLRTDSSTTLYVKQTGTGNTGWVAK